MPTSRRDDQCGGGAAFSTRHQAQCRGERRASTCPADTPRWREAPGHLMGMATARRTAPTRAPRRPAKPQAAGQRTAPPPDMPRCSRHAAPRSKPHRRIPTGCLRARLTPPRLGSEDSPTVALEQGARKLFREAQGAPRKTRAHPRFAFAPCAAAFPQAPSAPQGAPRGRAPTRGGRQPWERASTRGRTRQSART